MARLEVTWDHVPAEEWSLEKWVTVVDGVALYITKLAVTLTSTDMRQYYWCNSYTGTRRQAGCGESLTEAMLAAIHSLRKDNNNEV